MEANRDGYLSHAMLNNGVPIASQTYRLFAFLCELCVLCGNAF